MCDGMRTREHLKKKREKHDLNIKDKTSKTAPVCFFAAIIFVVTAS